MKCLVRMIVIAIMTMTMCVCCDDDTIDLYDGLDFEFNRPTTEWGISASDVKTKMAQFELIKENDFALVFSGNLSEETISFFFKNRRLCASMVVFNQEQFNQTDFNIAKSQYKSVDGHNDTYINERAAIVLQFSTFTKSGKTYYSIGWAKADMHPAEPVDLGLSVKWSDVNLDVSTNDHAAYWEESYGGHYGYGDPTGKLTSVYLADYPSIHDISGTRYDIASAQWGDGWRLPSPEEFKELIDKCEWTWDAKRIGYLVTARNGNSIFLKSNGYYDEGVKYYSNNGYYWTGYMILSTEIYPEYCNFGEKFKGVPFTGDYGQGGRKRSNHLGIRPVLDY